MDYIYDKQNIGRGMMEALGLPPTLLTKDGINMKTAEGFHNILESLVKSQPTILPNRSTKYIDNSWMEEWGLERGIYYLSLTQNNYDLVKMFENNINNLFFSFNVYYYTERGDTMSCRLSQTTSNRGHLSNNPTSLMLNNLARRIGLEWPSPITTFGHTYLFSLDSLDKAARFINWQTDPFTSKD